LIKFEESYQLLMLRNLSGNVVKNKSKDVMLDEEGVGGGFEDKVLHERLWWIIISLELSQNIDQNSSVKHWLTVNSGDEVLYLLEGEASELLHDLDSALHLLTLECQQGLLRVVKLLKASPG